jgi:hypothetical protein
MVYSPGLLEGNASFRSPRLLAKVVSGILVLDLAATLVTAFILVDALALGRAIMAGHPVSADAFELLDRRAHQIDMVSLGILGLGAVMFFMWTYRVASNVRGRIDFSPGWAVGSYFVPILNLSQPYRSLADVWDASDPDPTADPSAPRSHALLLAWWLVWLGSSWVTLALTRTTEVETAEQWVTRLHMRFIPLAVDAIAVALALAVVWKLTARQEARAMAVMPTARINEG